MMMSKLKWVEPDHELPPDETPVLLIRKGKLAIGERRWEHPTFEENFRSFWFWADVDDNWHDDQGEATVTYWAPMPEFPGAQSTPKPPPTVESWGRK